MAAEFLYFHFVPESFAGQAELLNSLLAALKNLLHCAGGALLVSPACVQVLACTEEDVELPGCFHFFSCTGAFLALLSSRSGQGGAPWLSSLQLCCKETLLSPEEEESALNSVVFLNVEPIEMSHKLSCF